MGVCIEVCKCLCVYYMYAGAFCGYARGDQKLINLRCCSSGATYHWIWSLLIRLDRAPPVSASPGCSPQVFISIAVSLDSGAHVRYCDKHVPIWAISSANHPHGKFSVISMKFSAIFTFSVFSLWSTKWHTMFWGFFIRVSLRHVHDTCTVLWSRPHGLSHIIALLCLPSLLPPLPLP